MAEIKETPKSFSDRAKHAAKLLFRHENAVLAGVLIAIIAVIAVRSRGSSITKTNIRGVMLQSSARGLASIGQTFVLLTAGIDVSVGGLALLCLCMAGGLMTLGQQRLLSAPVAMYIAIPIMLLVGAAVGALTGALVSRIRLPPLIVTLAMWKITYGVAYQFSRGVTIVDLPRILAFLGQGDIAGVPVPVIVWATAIVAAYFVLYHTIFGRSIYAVGGNPVSAWLSGISVKNILFSVYIISGFMAGLAGLVTMSRIMCASLTSMVNLEIDSIAAVCIGGVSLAGGRGTLIGAMIGVLIIGVINNGLNIMMVDPSYQDIIKGVIIIIAVAIDYMRRR